MSMRGPKKGPRRWPSNKKNSSKGLSLFSIRVDPFGFLTHFLIRNIFFITEYFYGGGKMMMKKNTLSIGILFLFTFALVLLITHELCHAKPDLGNLRIPFVPNEGQMDDSIKFYAKTFMGTESVTGMGDLVYSATSSLPARAWQVGKLPACPAGPVPFWYRAGRPTPQFFT